MSEELLVTASYLHGKHVGMEAHLPGELNWETYEWTDTWAPITMIQHMKNGSVKIRRHPDSHTDHKLAPGDRVLLREVRP